MTLTAQINVALKARLTGAGDLGKPAVNIELNAQHLFGSGTGAGQIDRIFADRRTIAESVTEDLDLAGSLLDPLGAACVFAKVKAIAIKAAATNPGDLKFGGDANAFVGFFDDASDELIIPPGATKLFTAPGAGKAVTASTGDIVQIASAATAGSYQYEIVILGTSA